MRRTISNNASVASNVDSEKPPEDPLVGTLLDKIHHFQRFLAKEREAATIRETGFGQNLRVIQILLTDILSSGPHHHHSVPNGETLETSEIQSPLPCVHSNGPAILPIGNVSPHTLRGNPELSSDTVVERIMALSANLSQRMEEVKACDAQS